MGVYTRFKRNPEGFRQLVELLESTPATRRQKMIDVGMLEDPEYTQRALEYVLKFEDILKLPDEELAEVLAKAPARMTAYSITTFSEEIKTRFLRCSRPVVGAEIKDFLEVKIGPREIGGAQMKLIETARQLERRGLVKTKRIPV